MVAEPQQITSLNKPPEGWEWQPGRRDWGATHPAYNGMDKRPGQNGPRPDAEPTDALPELTPGISRLPTSCTHCGSGLLNAEEPLGEHQRGMLSCGGCGRQVCWLLRSISPSRRPSVTSAADPPTPPRSAPIGHRAGAVAVQGRFNRTPACASACSIVYGHDPALHEGYGFRQAEEQARVKPTGAVRTGILTFDFDTLETRVNGQPIRTTPSDTKILAVLAASLGTLVTRFELVERAWDRAQADLWTRPPASVIGTHLTRLRQTLGPAADLIQTVPGRGLILRKVPPVDDASRERPGPRLRPGRLRDRLVARPGRAGGLLLARSRSRRVRRLVGGGRRLPFRIRSEDTAVSNTNGTATVEAPALAIATIAPALVESSQAVEPAPTPAPSTDARPSALEEADRWYADVLRLRDALAEEETALLANLARVRATLGRMHRVAAIFDGPEAAKAPAPPLGADAVVRPEGRRRSPNALPEGKWSRHHDACVACGRTDRQHKSKGRCSACDATARQQTSRATKEQTS